LLAGLDTGLFADLDAAGLAAAVGLATDSFLAAVDLGGFVTLELEEAAEAGFFSAFFSPFFSAGLPIFKKKKETKRK